MDGVVRLGVGSVDDVDESARPVDVGGRGGSGAEGVAAPSTRVVVSGPSTVDRPSRTTSLHPRSIHVLGLLDPRSIHEGPEFDPRPSTAAWHLMSAEQHHPGGVTGLCTESKVPRDPQRLSFRRILERKHLREVAHRILNRPTQPR